MPHERVYRFVAYQTYGRYTYRLFRLLVVRGIHRQQGDFMSLFFVLFLFANERSGLKHPEHTFLSPAKLEPDSSSPQYSYSEVTSIRQSSKIFRTEGRFADRDEQSENSLASVMHLWQSKYCDKRWQMKFTEKYSPFKGFSPTTQPCRGTGG